MTLYAVVLITKDGTYEGRQGLRVVQADSPEAAVRAAHPEPPSHLVKHAWVHELVGKASLVEVDLAHPKWGATREAAST